MSLSKEDLERRIQQVKEDINRLNDNPSSTRKLSVLAEYQEYLEDELKQLINQQKGQ